MDEGFLVSMDYGADADALLWQALVHPSFSSYISLWGCGSLFKVSTSAKAVRQRETEFLGMFTWETAGPRH